MEQNGFIVSIDFGTSFIRGVVGRKNEQGIISILASESISSDSCIRYGVIYNIQEAAGKFKRIINLLENQIGKKIAKVYVSIAGRSLRAHDHSELKRFEAPTLLSYVDIDNMEQRARTNKLDFFTNYSVLAPEYYLDEKLTQEPIGKTASIVEGRYKLMIGAPSIKRNLDKAVESANLSIAGYVIGPAATGAFLLGEEDRKEGCVLIDFGAGTTTVSVYKDDNLRYMTVIPFGGRTITKDIQELGFVYESAEEYKKRYGKLGAVRVKMEKTDAPDVDLRELNKVIQLRQDEIVLNVINQINESGYLPEDLKAGVLLTGSASRMDGMLEYLEDKMKMPVKIAAPQRVYINNASDLVQDQSYTQVLSLLLYANENCEKLQAASVVTPRVEKPAEQQEATTEPEPRKQKEEPKKEKRQTNFMDMIERKFQNLGGAFFKDEE